MLGSTYFAQNDAGIICQGLPMTIDNVGKSSNLVVSKSYWVNPPASSPGPIPSFSMLHAEKRKGLVREVTCVTPWHMHVTLQGPKVALWRLPVSSYRFWKEGLLVHYFLFKWSYYNRLYVLEPYLWPATNGSAYKTADLWPTHTHQTFCLHLVYLLSTYDVAHVISHTRLARPSHFSVCNIKNWEWAWDEAMNRPQGIIACIAYYCTFWKSNFHKFL